MPTGRPHFFVCPVARKNQEIDWDGFHAAEAAAGRRVSIRPFYRYPDGHRRIVRTGRMRGEFRETFGGWDSRHHEYRCECGHVGWTKHKDIFRYPLAEVDA